MKHWIWGWLFAIAPLDPLPPPDPFSALFYSALYFRETDPCKWHHTGPHAHWRVRPVGSFGRILKSRRRDKVAVCCCPSWLPLTLPHTHPTGCFLLLQGQFLLGTLSLPAPRLQLSLVVPSPFFVPGGLRVRVV